MTDTLLDTERPSLYVDEWVEVDTVTAIDHDGSPYPHRRVKLTTGRGGVIICVRGSEEDPEIAFAHVNRPACGMSDSLELPRGTTEDLGLAEAARELDEELGLRVLNGRYLGVLYPDTGALSNQVGVWVADFHEHREGPVEHETEWVPLTRAIRDTRIKCGITLAAMMLLVRWIESD